MTADREAEGVIADREAGAMIVVCAAGVPTSHPRSSHPPFRPHRPPGGAARKGARDE